VASVVTTTLVTTMMKSGGIQTPVFITQLHYTKDGVKSLHLFCTSYHVPNSYPLVLSWTKQTQSTVFHPIYLRHIWIVSSRLCLDHPCSLFPSGFPHNTLRALILSGTCPVPSHPIDWITVILFGKDYELCSSSLRNLLQPALFPLTSK